MLHNIEMSAAPHLPPVLRPGNENYAIADFKFTLNGDLQIVEENGELRLLAYPNTAE